MVKGETIHSSEILVLTFHTKLYNIPTDHKQWFKSQAYYVSVSFCIALLSHCVTKIERIIRIKTGHSIFLTDSQFRSKF